MFGEVIDVYLKQDFVRTSLKEISAQKDCRDKRGAP